MQAVLVHDSAVSIGDAPMPTISTGEVLVRVRATALNRADLLQRAGSYPPPPGESEILGLELAGEVEQVFEGDTSHSIRVGERVCALVAGGGYAQYARVSASSVIRVPEWLTFEQAAALPEAWMTAYQALHWVAGLTRHPTKSVLIHAGASGVGLAAIQLAKLQPGVRVLVTAGSQDKLDACIRLGADVAINYKEGDFAPKVLEATANQGVDIILDFIGASYWSQNLSSLAVEGRLVLLGTMGGSVAGSTDVGIILRKRLQVLGTTLRARTKEYKAQLAAEMSALVLPHLQEGRLVLQIDRVFPWTQVDDAHRHMSTNSNIGKIVMLVD